MGGLNELEAALREGLGDLDFPKRDRAVPWHRDGASILEVGIVGGVTRGLFFDGAAAHSEGLKYDSELEIRTLEPPS